MITITNVSRRGFLKATGVGAAGLVLGFALPEWEKLEAQFNSIPVVNPSAYLRIGTDDSVTFIAPKAEMGQGSLTGLAMILADELDCDWSKIKTEFAPVDPKLYGAVQGVVGSFSIRSYWEPMRHTGATARAMLLQAAANRWKVNTTALRTDNGFVVNPANNQRLSYGTIADEASKLPVPTNVALKDVKDFKLIRKPVKRLETREKITGKTKFGIDMRMDGMVYAVLQRSPVFGGKVVSFDATKAKAVPGVKNVVQISNGVAVIAENTWAANMGRKALEIKWDENGSGSVDSAAITKMFQDKLQQKGAVARSNGNVATALAGAAKKMEATYEVPFLSHAPMEPMNCTAHVHANGCDVWAPTQMQTFSRDAAAKAAGLPPEKVNIHTQFMGGGFGRRGSVDYVAEAVEISKAVGAPVKLTWTREDDMQHDLYRPASLVKFEGALDADGWPTAFAAKIATPPFPAVDQNGIAFTAVEGIRDIAYAIPNVQVDYHRADTHVPVTFWRSVGYSQNTFFTESFIDEMAAAGGKDPLEFRRRLLRNEPRLLNVLNLAAEKGGWGKAPAGHFQGIGLSNNIGSFTAMVAEISITNNKLKIHKVTCAVDCGHHVNPATVRQQMESGIVYGLTAGLKGAITIDKGRVKQSNFHDYEMLRIQEMPLIETHIVISTEAPGGIGEASTPSIAPAVANAIFKATGKRLRRLPMRDADLA
jgi:isoquinoline 1-oxidoreductase subunit beta